VIHFRSIAGRPAQLRRMGLAALEVVMVVGALMPISVLIGIMLRSYLVYHHAHVGSVVGSPLM
jgi:hypothetical protein